MRTLSIVLALGLLGVLPATASAKGHHKKHHARSHAKMKQKKARSQHASIDRTLMQSKTA
jgi:hypothetical protein